MKKTIIKIVTSLSTVALAVALIVSVGATQTQAQTSTQISSVCLPGWTASSYQGMTFCLPPGYVIPSGTTDSASTPVISYPSSGSSGSSGPISSGSSGTILSCSTFNTNLTTGSSGPEVSTLQYWLMANGFNIPAIASGITPPGYFGSQTAVAVRLFQVTTGSSYVIAEDGYFGPYTRSYINKRGCEAPSSGGGGGGSTWRTIAFTPIDASYYITGMEIMTKDVFASGEPILFKNVTGVETGGGISSTLANEGFHVQARISRNDGIDNTINKGGEDSINAVFDYTTNSWSGSFTGSYPAGTYTVTVILYCSQQGSYCDTKYDGTRVGFQDEKSFVINVVDQRQPSITVLSPKGGETYEAGGTMEIRWNSQGISADSVRIELDYKHNDPTYGAGQYFRDWIAEKTANTGYYRWNIPEYYARGVDPQSFSVNVVADGFTGYSEKFNIIPGETQAVLSVSQPTGGTYSSGSSVPVTWTRVTNEGYSVNLLRKSDPSFLRLSLETTGTAPNLTWRVPTGLPSGNDYYLRVNESPYRAFTGYSGTFSLGTQTQPSITTLTPSSNTTWTLGQTYPITWTTQNAPSTQNIRVVWLINTVTGQYYQLAAGLPNTGSANIKVSSVTGAIPPGTYKLEVRLTATVMSQAPGTITLVEPTAQPSITVTSPNGGQTYEVGQSLNTALSIPVRWTSTGLTNSSEKALWVALKNENGGVCNIGSISSYYQLANIGVYTGYQCPSTGWSITPGRYKAFVYLEGDTTVKDESDNYFTITSSTETRPPFISSVVSPIRNGEKLSFNGERLYFGSGVSVYIDDKIVDSRTIDGDKNATLIFFPLPNLTVGQHRLYVKNDLSGTSNTVYFQVENPSATTGTIDITMSVGGVPVTTNGSCTSNLRNTSTNVSNTAGCIRTLTNQPVGTYAVQWYYGFPDGADTSKPPVVTSSQSLTGGGNIKFNINFTPLQAVTNTQSTQTSTTLTSTTETARYSAERRAVVRLLYLELLKREPDQPGWDYWTNNFGTTLQVRQGIMNSVEYQRLQSGQTVNTSAAWNAFWPYILNQP